MVQGDIVFIAAIYEVFVIFITLFLVILTLNKYIQIRNKLTLILFLIFLNILLGVIFSWLSKIIVLTTDIDYVYNEPTRNYPTTPLYLIYLRIVDFRLALAFVSIAAFFSYVFKANIFEEEHAIVTKVIFYSYNTFVIFFSIFIYERGNTFLDAINFLFVLVLVSIVYVPFMVKSINSAKSSADSFIRKKIFSLALMSLCLMCVIFCFLIDRVLVLMGAYHFTFFYFLAWILNITGIVCAYLGYIKSKPS